jgi:hypothetical protein
MVENKSIFWQALIFTLVIFVLGLIFGFFVESFRTDRVVSNLQGSETSLLDEQLRSKIVGESNISCDLAKSSLFTFADRTYSEALKLENYGAASKFSNDMLNTLHKRYDLLRMMMWLESINLKERCGNFHAIVYFFDYEPQKVGLSAEQNFFSGLLTDLKNRHPAEILLIPIASNLDTSSIELAMEDYNITRVPSILIDEKKIVDGVITLEELENITFSGDKLKKFK